MKYITFQIRPTAFLIGMGFQTRKFAIACENDIEAYAVGADINSLEGIAYINVRHTKPRKGTTVLSSKDNYLKYIHLWTDLILSELNT